jgi:hypothetical protein
MAAEPALAAFKQSPTNTNPLTIWIGDNGWFQDKVADNADNSFFPQHEPQSTNGNANAGFVLAFPDGQTGVDAEVAGKVWGWTPNLNGPTFNHYFTPAPPVPPETSDWTGSGTGGDPYKQVTKYQIVVSLVPKLEVDQTTTYINGESNFVIEYVVKNLMPVPVRFRALVGADVYLNESDCGVGVFKAGPPRFVGGSSLGRVGGFTEASSPWTGYFEGSYGGPPGPCQTGTSTSPGVWDYLQGAWTGNGFPNTVDTSYVDNGIGVQWDTYYGPSSALAADAESAPFQLNTLGFVPGELSLLPSSQSVNAGSQATLGATARDSSGGPASAVSLRYIVSGANSASGSATTGSDGQATISYTPTRAGTDTVAAYEDLDANGVQGQGEPHATATVTVQGQGPAALDRTPPGLTISARRSVKRKALLKGILAVARCNEACSLKFELLGTKGRRSKRFTRSLARKSLPTAGAGKRGLILKPKRKLVSRARKFNVQLRVTATDRAGNRTVKTRLIKVK